MAPRTPTVEGALLSAEEASRILSISLRTLREHVKDGTIPRIIIGRGKVRKHYGFDRDDIEAFKRARKKYEERPTCPSTSPKNRRSTTTISNVMAVDFTALRAQLTSAKPQK